MLRTDLHIHTCFSDDSGTSPQKLVEHCLKLGLNCIAITDHNTIAGALEVQSLTPITVIIGEEIKTSGGDIIGLFLKSEIPPGLTPRETAESIKEQGGLLSIPHPFDRIRSSVITASALREVLPFADIVEAFNARNIFDKSNLQADELARMYGLARSAVSDAHCLMEMGATYVNMPEFDGTSHGFMTSIIRGELITHKSNPMFHVITTYQKFKSRFLRRAR